MFRKVLIANRGEIACRIIRTAKRMGIRSVAVYSEADRDALHVREADEAYHIGPAAATESYLKIEAIVSVAKEAGAEAIHPGYGFLAENADFAEACAAAGLVFIGPPATAIRAMGDKAAAKAIMEKAGVPVVPGYHGKTQDRATLLKAAERIGFPVLLKAAAGGGGKGMRIVRREAEFEDALAGAKRESKAAFGDDRMLVEKLIQRPRHIEVQVFGDGLGNIVHLFERDCSVQRRHQKVIEEAPAPGVDDGWRAGICGAAVAAARAVDYVGAGTVEFIVESGPQGRPGDFFFMEMNTRLQVEHPVTEMITGTDLVEWQFRVAAGEPLPMAQEDIRMTGHAVEARLYAEDPANGFLPSPGRVSFMGLPKKDARVRVDQGIAGSGSAIPAEYDPMIAKIIAWRGDRDETVSSLKAAMDEVRITGVTTNASFLSRVLAHPAFRAGGVDTGLLDRSMDELLPAGRSAPSDVLALACLGLLRQQQADAAQTAALSRDPWSPWARADGWRLNDFGQAVLRLIDGGGVVDIPCRFEPPGYRLALPEGTVVAQLGSAGSWHDDDEPVLIDEAMRVQLDGLAPAASVIRDGDTLHVFHEGGHWRLGIHDPLAAAEAHEGASGGLTAPMPGRIAAVQVKKGQTVAAGQPLIVVEAMKMEHTIPAPAAGTVSEIRFKAGDQVREGEVLVVVEEETV
ncbi:MAG: acetyl-CoA carboxylase biotin carboxylase subunit [Rhodospirillales bacterium]|nr:MAG: acetyl-CoA carboxylase biotin carboxylase subunit [Rhodospirillales bacterium]